MKSKKLGSVFLSMLLVFTLLIAVGCGKGDDKEPDKKVEPTPTTSPEKKDDKSGKKDDSSKKTVKLLKRNGVEWKENKTINSKRGAKSYKVVWGDTLKVIAKTWRVNTRKLAKYNKLKNADLIEVGQIIYNYAAKK